MRFLPPLLVVVIVGCSRMDPPASPVPTAQPVCSSDDGRRALATIQRYGREWDDALAVAQNSARIQLGTAVMQLQRIRRDLEGEQIPDCADGPRRRLVGAMDAYIDGFLGFMGDRRGYESDLRRGGEQMSLFANEMAIATGQPTPIPRPTTDSPSTAVAGTAVASNSQATSTAIAVQSQATIRSIVAPVDTAIAKAPATLPARATLDLAPPGSNIVTYRVQGTGAAGLIVRDVPNGQRVASVNEGDQVAYLRETQTAAGREWKKVRATDGTIGWAVSEFLK